MKLMIGLLKGCWVELTAAVIVALAVASPVSGAIMEVAAGDVPGLIAAIEMANDEMAYPGEDTIVLAAGERYLLMEAHGVPQEQNGLPQITSDIVINGNNATIARKGWDGLFRMFRFFTVGAGGGLTLDNLVLEGGYASKGGAIYNANYLAMNGVILRANRDMNGGGGGLYNYNNAWAELNRVTLQGNSSEGYSGGAIFNRMGYVGVYDSTFTANLAPMGGGGALYAMRYAQTVIDGCTLEGNQSRFEGGALHNGSNAFLEVKNSTLSGNHSQTYGGAVANVALSPNTTVDNATTRIIFSTLVDNQGDLGGAAVYSRGDADDTVSVRFAGTLVASKGAVVSQCYGAMLVADVSSLTTDATCGYAFPVGYGELELGPLAFNGGVTRTYALMPGSLAIDWLFTEIATGVPEFDQRGIARPQNGSGIPEAIADVGAFEHETLIAIDIQPKDAANVVKLSDKHLDVLVPQGTGGLDVAALTAAEMVGAEIVFGDNLVSPTEDLTIPNKLAQHQVPEGLLLHFRVAASGLDGADEQACLAMHFADGRVFRGCDVVRVVR